MAKKPEMKIEDMIDRLRSGEVSPGSREGSDMIRKIALSSPRDLTTRLFHLSNASLEKAMKTAGMKEDQIEEILGTDVKGDIDDVQQEDPLDPFAKHTELAPEPDLEVEHSPYEYDPGEEMRKGPRPPR